MCFEETSWNMCSQLKPQILCKSVDGWQTSLFANLIPLYSALVQNTWPHHFGRLGWAAGVAKGTPNGTSNNTPVGRVHSWLHKSCEKRVSYATNHVTKHIIRHLIVWIRINSALIPVNSATADFSSIFPVSSSAALWGFLMSVIYAIPKHTISNRTKQTV